MAHDPSSLPTHDHSPRTHGRRIGGLFATLAPHTLCCGVPVVAALAGVSVIDAHNPVLEYGLAVMAPIAGKAFHDHVWPRLRPSHQCAHDHQPLMTRLRDYGLLVSFSVALMAGHQYFFHDSHQADPTHSHEQHVIPDNAPHHCHENGVCHDTPHAPLTQQERVALARERFPGLFNRPAAADDSAPATAPTANDAAPDGP